MKERVRRMYVAGERLHIGRGQSRGLRNGRGAYVQVLSGELWVTYEGDRRDLFFANGDRFEIARNGLTVLHAVKPSRVRVEKARPLRWRALAWWKALARRVMKGFIAYGMHRAVKNRAYRL